MGAVIHNVMVLLSCGLVCYASSFLPVFSVSPTFPTQHSHLIFFLAFPFFGVGLLVIVFTALQILSLLVLDVEFSECLLWNGYTLVFFCGLFLVEHTAQSCTFTQSWFWEVYLSISEFRCGCLYVFHFVGLRLFQIRVRSAKWADSPRAPSQVNGRSSPYYDISSLSQSLRMCIPRRLFSGSNFIVFTIIRI